MYPRIIGYETYTGETPEGRPLFKVTKLTDLGFKHVTKVVYESESYDEAREMLRACEDTLTQERAKEIEY